MPRILPSLILPSPRRSRLVAALSTWPGILRCVLVCWLCLIVPVTLFPGIDLWFAGLFYLGDNRFWLYHTSAGDLLDESRVLIGFTALVVVVLTALFTRWVDNAHRIWTWRESMAPLLTFLVSVVIVVNAIFKDIWGRARPRYITDFGGVDSFSRAWVIPGPCDSNCSFVTGDGAFAFAFVSLAMLALGNRSKFVVGALFLGLWTGVLRMMMGAHFLSDVLYSGVITLTIALLIHRLVVGEKPLQALGLGPPLPEGLDEPIEKPIKPREDSSPPS